MSNVNAIPPDGGFAQFPERINKAGRPRKIFTILKESGYTKDDIRCAYNELAWADVKELKRLFEDENSPAIIKVIANALNKAISKGDYRYVKEIIEQVIGQPKETIDAKVSMIKINVDFNADTGIIQEE